MMKQNKNLGARLLAVLVVVLAFAMAVSCDNDNDDPGLPGFQTGLTASFTAGGAAVANSMTLQANSAADDVFLVDVVITGIDNFYGAAFDVDFNAGLMNLIAVDATNSFIIPGGGTVADLTVLENLDGNDVTISRQNFALGGVTPGTGVLATLQFRALRELAGEPITLSDIAITTCTVAACDLDAVNTLGVTDTGGTVTAIAN